MSKYLSICAIYRDEARYLAEWIEFHRLVGVERFILYDNFSVDKHRDVLASYVERGIVEHHDWHVRGGQASAYNDCLKRHRQDSRWIAFLDCDEFLFSPTGRPVSELLVDYESAPGVVVNWAMFGTSGHLTEPDGLVIDNYLMRRSDISENCMFKSVVDPTRSVAAKGVHRFVHIDGPAVDENLDPIGDEPRSATPFLSYSRLRINHYFQKSEETFRNKRARLSARTGGHRPELSEEQYRRSIRDFNQEQDTTITMYLPSLRKALGLNAPATRNQASTSRATHSVRTSRGGPSSITKG